MVLCNGCGADIIPDSKFCKYCGTTIDQTPTPSPLVAPPPPEDFAHEMAEAGKRFGGEMGRVGDRFGKDIANRWDTTLGILSPMVIGVFGVVLILFGLFVTDIIASRSDTPQIWEHLADFIADNFPILAGLMFLGAFHAYLYRRYRRSFRWIAPVVSAVIVTVWAWVLAELLMLAGQYSDHPGFGDAGRFLEALLVAVFILGVLVGYAILWFSLVSPANWDKPEKRC